MDSHAVLYAISALLILTGLAGVLLPALPGLPLMFAGMLLAAWTDDFRQIGGWTIVLLGVLTAAALIADIGASVLGAKRAGASKLALVGAGAGLLLGLFFGLPGMLLGPFLGAVAGEMGSGKPWQQASKTGFATWLGLAVGAAIKVGLALAMLGIFGLALIL